MKKKSAISLALLSLLFVGVSCMSDSEEEIVVSPYALVKSFSLGNIKSEYPSFTSDGRDTTVTRTVNMSVYPFTINQATGEIYNNDSLPYATDVTKVVTVVSSIGVPSIYDDSTDIYVAYSGSDSIDFTKPRKLRVYSSDASYFKDYTIRVNVHSANPELMVWNKWDAPAEIIPQKAIEFAGGMCIFGSNADGSSCVSVSPLDGEPAWASYNLSGLPEETDFATMQQFGGKLYVVAAGDLYSSADAFNWSVALQGCRLIAVVSASDDSGEIVVASDSRFYGSSDGTAFEEAGAVPEGFPLYGASLVSYPLNHNKAIIRHMAMGYDSKDRLSAATVWSRLSTDSGWVEYENESNPFPCPSLKGLSVVRYDNFLYALGGAGKSGERDVEAFASFFVSKDNGIVWKELSTFYQRLPEALLGNNSEFAVTVDSGNVLWIVVSGAEGGVWKGIINRLGFEK